MQCYPTSASLAGQCSTKPNVSLNRSLCPVKGQKCSPAVTEVTLELLLINMGDLQFPLQALGCKLNPEREPTNQEKGSDIEEIRLASRVVELQEGAIPAATAPAQSAHHK